MVLVRKTLTMTTVTMRKRIWRTTGMLRKRKEIMKEKTDSYAKRNWNALSSIYFRKP